MGKATVCFLLSVVVVVALNGDGFFRSPADDKGDWGGWWYYTMQHWSRKLTRTNKEVSKTAAVMENFRNC